MSCLVVRYEGDVEEFLRRSANVHKGKVNIIHSSFDPVDIHVRDHRAISEAFCLVTSSLTFQDVDYELASYMRLATRLEKLESLQSDSDASKWHILSLEAIYVRDRIITAFPGSPGAALSSDLPLMMTEKVQNYPKSYRHLALVMLNRGLKPRTDLPHEDDQESIRRVLQRNRTYLDGTEE